MPTDSFKCIGKSKNCKGKIINYVIKKNNTNVIKVLDPVEVKTLLKNKIFSISNLSIDKYDRITNKITLKAN